MAMFDGYTMLNYQRVSVGMGIQEMLGPCISHSMPFVVISCWGKSHPSYQTLKPSASLVAMYEYTSNWLGTYIHAKYCASSSNPPMLLTNPKW